MNIVQEDIKTIIDGIDWKRFENKEVLLTGACGFLGSWFVAVFQELNKNYLKTPVRVYGLDSFIAADKENSIVNVKDNNIILRKDDASTFQLDGSVDFIIHAAGIASPIYYRKFPIETIEGMVFGLNNLLKFAVKNPVESFLYFSSSEIYGNPYNDKVPTTEDYNGNVSPIGPRSCYDESKRMGEALCVAYHKMHNIPVKWVRPFNVSGAGMRINDDRVVPKFVFQALRGEPLTVHTPATQTRTFCYITDAMIGFFRTLLDGVNGEVYNIGNDSPEVSMLELAGVVKNVVADVEIKTVEVPQEYPQDQANRRCPNLDKAKKDLKYQPIVGLEDIVKRTAIWGKEQLNAEVS